MGGIYLDGVFSSSRRCGADVRRCVRACVPVFRRAEGSNGPAGLTCVVVDGFEDIHGLGDVLRSMRRRMLTAIGGIRRSAAELRKAREEGLAVGRHNRSWDRGDAVYGVVDLCYP